MIIVYTEKETSRLRFVLDQLIVRALGMRYSLTTDREEYLSSVLPGICYTGENLGRGLWMIPFGLLEEKGWKPLVPAVLSLDDGMPVLFPAEEISGNAPFDLFSASFYLLSRYEEYYSTDLDEHGRYQYTASVLYRMNSLEFPLVDRWTQWLDRYLKVMYPTLAIPGRKHRVVITHDIDHSYLYRNKGFIINIYGLLRDMLHNRMDAVGTRLRTLAHLQEDPYFNIPYLLRTDLGNGFSPHFFIHAGPYGKYDRKAVYPSWRYRKIMRVLAQECEVGLHPSYCSDSKLKLIRKEHKRLECWLDKVVYSSRQHFLRFTFPDTFRVLLKAGIRKDYSVGYSHACGFRAGTSIPFPFFDLETNVETSLMLHPLVVMDVTLKRDRGLSSTEARETILRFNAVCRYYGGDFTLLMHNSSLSDQEGWDGWRAMYDRLLQDLSMGRDTHML